MRSDVQSVTVTDTGDRLRALSRVVDDVRAAGSVVGAIDTVEAEGDVEGSVQVVLAPTEA